MRRLSFALIVLAVLIPSPALAHGGGGGGGGVSLPLLVVGLAAAAGGVALGARASLPPWTAGGLVMVGIALVLGSFFAGGNRDDRPDVHLAVVEPRPGAQVPAGTPVPVRVAIDGGALATTPQDDGGHLHLYVDRKLQQMPYSTEAQVTLTPGRHTLTVEYVDNRHVSYEPPIEETIEVSAG